jgi:hypothetical protein
MTHEGSIEAVLWEGEYDCGDVVVIDYDELADLARQADWMRRWIQIKIAGEFITPHSSDEQFAKDEELASQEWNRVLGLMQNSTNRPLHPVMGGPSPYSEFLPLGDQNDR